MAKQYQNCPKCETDAQPKPVGFTWWGGLLGPKMLSHVKCVECGAAYNGKTGQSNTRGIVIYSVVAAVIVLALFAAFAFLR